MQVSTLFVAVQLGRFDLPFLYTDDATLADMLSKNFFVMAFYVVGDGALFSPSTMFQSHEVHLSGRMSTLQACA
eukprot:SAG31_NODE_751_length_12354_cov_14.018605_3_plen_74_part_00